MNSSTGDLFKDLCPYSIEDLYRRCRDRLVDHAMQLTRDKDSAEDAVQRAFLRILQRTDPRPLRFTYLFVAVRNECLADFRRDRRMATLAARMESPAPDSLDEDWDEAARADLLARWKGALPDRQSAVVGLWNQGQTYEQIAVTLDLTARTVQTHLDRAKAKLVPLAQRERERVGNGE